ncbi:outer membrane beta-barrel protein [Pedobacter kyonggii]|uniref:outer membrane beta-barrel protein n=1 Tax=Pedobacter kyonggii TaxID=1926871 RepID=UPI001ABF3AFE
MNVYNFKQKGFYANQDFDFSGNIITSRLSTQVKLPKKLSFQGRYNFSGAQSKTASTHNIDLGVSKTFLKDKATLIFDVANLFNLRKFETTTIGTNYLLTQVNSPNAARYYKCASRMVFYFLNSGPDGVNCSRGVYKKRLRHFSVVMAHLKHIPLLLK